MSANQPGGSDRRHPLLWGGEAGVVGLTAAAVHLSGSVQPQCIIHASFGLGKPEGFKPKDG